MSSTNKTTNYQLSQFVGTDKPAWLTDYNQDMSKIDTGIKAAADNATAADGKADANATKIGDLANLTTTAKTNVVAAVNEVVVTAGSAQSTAATAQNTAASANTTAQTALNNTLAFNFTQNGECTLSATSGTVGNYSHLYYAANANGTVGKIYGLLNANENVAGQIIRATSPFRPQSKITINGVCRQYFGDKTLSIGAFTVDTDGTIEFQFPSGWGSGSHKAFFPACIYFMQDFGDVPVQGQ